jgi:hypothetical protein
MKQLHLLNHIFVRTKLINSVANHNVYYICERCNHIIYEVFWDKMSYRNSSHSTIIKNGLLNTSCEEMMIKKLLE